MTHIADPPPPPPTPALGPLRQHLAQLRIILVLVDVVHANVSVIIIVSRRVCVPTSMFVSASRHTVFTLDPLLSQPLYRIT